jgi:hypothetical protein
MNAKTCVAGTASWSISMSISRNESIVSF